MIQEFVPGEVSGVAFGENPLNPGETIIEAVPGLNEGLVDGKIEPDRWLLDRKTGELRYRYRAERDEVSAEGELLNSRQTQEVFALVQEAESLFGAPQDVEWTFRQGDLYILQSRPITGELKAPEEFSGSRVRSGEVPDKRGWYLSLRPNFEKLQDLRENIEDELIPELLKEAKSLAAVVLEALSDRELKEAISEREQRRDYWLDVYWDTFIPFAHGVRLFGRVYNDMIQPEDPYEFVELLRSDQMESVERDRLMAELARLIRGKPDLQEAVSTGDFDRIDDREFKRLFSEIQRRMGTSVIEPAKYREFGKLLLEMSEGTMHGRAEKQKTKEKVERFLDSFHGEDRGYARKLFELGRSSYRLRDDDNIYLGLIEQELERAKREQAKRSGTQETGKTQQQTAPPSSVKPAIGKERQLVGQPAGAGLATARARVIHKQSDLFEIREGEVIVCDAIDPTMTFVIPLAAGIVERRGGMLIHGAIIAREYGIPCVTGIVGAIDAVRTGDHVTVDGYLGIVLIRG